MSAAKDFNKAEFFCMSGTSENWSGDSPFSIPDLKDFNRPV